MKKTAFTSLLLGLAGYLFISCTENSDKLSGPATEEGNPAVLAGTIVDPLSKPSSNAVVQVYRAPFISDSATFVPNVDPVAVTVTDDSGGFYFYELTSGIYIIESIDSSSSAYAISSAVTVMLTDSIVTVYLDTLFLKFPGTIRGKVTRGNVLGSQSNQVLDDGFIQVMLLEIDREDITRRDGSYELTNIPEGIYTLAFYATDGFLTAYRDSVRVGSGDTVYVETITLQRVPWLAPPKPKNLTADYDTANALVNLQWSPVNVGNLLGYQVERRVNPLIDGLVFTTADTVYTDTVTSIQSGTTLYYVVRAVNESFMVSANEGPVEVVVK